MVGKARTLAGGPGGLLGGIRDSDRLEDPATDHRSGAQRSTGAKLAKEFEFIDGWRNPHRRHSLIGQMLPMNYKTRYFVEPLIYKPLPPRLNRGTSTPSLGILGPGAGSSR
ncbi:MAG: hypothetical protein U5R48_15535 [Gammaproteobacteria bacterium]|nr:hypothetical protein [Gammaproteobacteria bacterium]